MESPEQRPVRLLVRDDLARSRLTVFFRLFLALPLFVWVTLRGIAAFLAAFANWLSVLVQREVPSSLHDFVASYVRYATQVSAYVFLAADPYPWFRSQADYPVDVEIDPPVQQGRWGGFFRLVLAVPALLLAAALGSGFATGSSGQGSWSLSSGSDETVWWSISSLGGAAAACAFLAWFVGVARGRAPRGLRDLTAFALGYGAQAAAYLFLLTPRYPTSDPTLAEPYSELPDHPVRAVVTDDLERPRLTVLFRLFLAIPHFVWIALWTVAVGFLAFFAWAITLVLGRLPSPLHRFFAAYVRYATHLVAFVYVVGRRFPGFTGREGSYGVDLAIDPPGTAAAPHRSRQVDPRDPGRRHRERTGRRCARHRVPRVVVRARHGPDARRNARPRRRLSALLRADLRICAPCHRPLSERGADPARARAGARTLAGLRRRRRVLKLAGVAFGVAALALGAFLLHPTAVPGDLTLGPIDVDSVFGADFVERAKRYERFFYVDWVLAQIALLVTLWIYAKRGAGFARESSAGPIGTGMLLGMLGLAIAWLVHVPFALAAHWWQRRWDQNQLSYVEWLFEDWALLAAQFLSISVALVIVMSLARRLGDRWWLPGAAVFVGIAALFTFVAPYLDFTTKPLRDEALLSAARDYESALGVGRIPLRVEEVSPDTDQANAYAFGIGPSRRVVFWDTILREPFTEDEQKVVLAHELAHHSQRHLPEGLGWFALFAIPGAWILMRATRSRGGMGTPPAVPLALFVVAVFQLATAPLANHISRRMEAEADWKALQVTRDPAALEGLMVEFSKTGLGDPDPPALAQLLFGTHPTLAGRVAVARAWSGHSGVRP